jgi:hypothetical protein
LRDTPPSDSKRNEGIERIAIYTNNRIYGTVKRNVGFEELTAVAMKSTVLLDCNAM